MKVSLQVLNEGNIINNYISEKHFLCLLVEGGSAAGDFTLERELVQLLSVLYGCCTV